MEPARRAEAEFAVCRDEPLSLPIGASHRQVNWSYAFAVGTYHLLALLAFVPWFYS
jgi:hypothetical protein